MFYLRKTLFVCLALATLCLGSAKGDTLIVVPGAQATSEGNSSNPFPFFVNAFDDLSSQRYQQVYAASSFSALIGPSLITQILFRPDAGDGSAFASTLSDVQINLSTTSAAHDALSFKFASNVGANDTIVYARGPLPLASSDTPGPGGSRNFDIIINLTTPFLYDPSQGNLLLDVRNFGGGGTTIFDAQSTLGGDAISRIYTFTANGANSLTADGGDTSGLVTAFNFAPSAPTAAVPEPTTMLLLGTGVAGVAAKVWRRKKVQADEEA